MPCLVWGYRTTSVAVGRATVVQLQLRVCRGRESQSQSSVPTPQCEGNVALGALVVVQSPRDLGTD